jgi:hypothetical protein
MDTNVSEEPAVSTFRVDECYYTVGVAYRHRVFSLLKKICQTVYGLILRNKQADGQDLLMEVSFLLCGNKTPKTQGHPNTSRDQNKRLKLARVSLQKQYRLGRKAV